MARVKRFIYNSDFMTIAHVKREQITATIPAIDIPAGHQLEEGMLTIPLKIPAQCFARTRLKYVGSMMTVDVACAGLYLVLATKNGKQIQYTANLVFEPDNLKIRYAVSNLTDASAILTDALTVTLTIDFLRQPNT